MQPVFAQDRPERAPADIVASPTLLGAIQDHILLLRTSLARAEDALKRERDWAERELARADLERSRANRERLRADELERRLIAQQGEYERRCTGLEREVAALRSRSERERPWWWDRLAAAGHVSAVPLLVGTQGRTGSSASA